MPLELYYLDASPPVRAVLLAGQALGLEFNLKLVDLFKKEHLLPEYLKLNPQHSIPTLVDDDFTIWDSHAIIGYLATKYAEDDSIYPKEAKARAIVDQRLHFDTGTLFPRLRNITRAGELLHFTLGDDTSSVIETSSHENAHDFAADTKNQAFYINSLPKPASEVYPLLFLGNPVISNESRRDVEEAYQFLEMFLDGHDWVAGDNMTIADFCCVSTVTSLDKLIPISSKFPNIQAWLSRCKENMVGYEKANQEGLNTFEKVVKSALAQK